MNHSHRSTAVTVICLLLLRGRQTPGEMRARCGRLHEFADNRAVEETLEGLIGHEGGALVARLPRTAGRRDFEYMHVFSGPIESVPADVEPRESAAYSASPRVDRIAGLESRIEVLERELLELKRILALNPEGST